MSNTLISAEPIVYPDSDGEPMAENNKQYEYIVTTKEGLEIEFENDPQVFIAADMFWYPVEGRPDIRLAPDTMLAFGRPKGYRSSYQQWLEGGIAPQVVFEIMSPGNRAAEMQAKFEFYERYNVEEYYVYDPDRGTLRGWIRRKGRLIEVETMHGWVSPQLGIRFELVDGEMLLYHSDGRCFETFFEVYQRAEQLGRDANREKRNAEREKRNAEREKKNAERERTENARAKQQAKQATDEATQAKQQAKQATDEADALKRQMKELLDKLQADGIDPRRYG